jgi:signal recognition particle GTPase
MAKDQQGTGGGTATHAGTNYQNRVAAWSAVHILAEQDAVPPWELPASITLESLQAETQRAVDDLAVQTSAGGSVLSQAKHTLSLQTTPDSPFGSAISQFVREYRSATPPLDAAKDRLVIATTSLSSSPIKAHLPAFLNRVRSSSAPDQEWTAGNKEENEAAATLRDHITRAWRAETDIDPAPADVIAILRLARIQILDVDESGQAEREAKQLLRSSILADPTAADAAWNTLITATAGYAVNAQRADRAALQRALTDAGIAIKAPRSFHADITRLKDHTTATLRGLIDFSRIHVGDQNVVIRRGAAADLRVASVDGHLLVLGVPGAGKSGAIYDLAHELDTKGADVVLFAVDQIEAASTGALRTELNLTREILTVLAAWPGTAPGYLIIDALDAARSEGAIKTLQTIISDVIASNSRWHVIASVRKFDLRYNPNLQRLFRGTPASTQYTDGEFPAIRHINIPVLADDELAQIQTQSPGLGALVSTAHAPLLELLHLPFNLRLLAELLDAGISVAELEPVRTQVELLDRYWRERIIRHDGQGDARELVLRRATSEMVARRALRVPRTAAIANDTASSAFLDDLLSTHVLAEWTTQTGAAQRDFLTFPHHLLFDYAVARLYIPAEAGDLIGLLSKEADLLIAIRPSIELHFQRLWHHDQAAFWDLTFHSLASSLNEVGKLLGPSVAALHATAINQTQPLIDCLNDPTRSPTGIAGLQHLLATLLTYGTTTGLIRPGPWIEFLDSATATLTPPLANSIRPYIIFLSDNAAKLIDADRQHVGTIARRLLAFALATTPPNLLLAINGINAVTKSISTDPTGSIVVLRQCITEEHLKNYGYRTFSTLARQVSVLVSIDPNFVRDVYVAGFENSDKSDEKTLMGDSQILPMSSNRKQDYELGLWSLAEHYSIFLDAAPREALDALLKITDQYVRGRRKATEDSVPIMLDELQSSLLRDNSFIWGSGVAQNDDPLKMLRAFQNYLERLTDATVIQQLVCSIATHQPPAVVWRILLSIGTKHPSTIGHAIRSLAYP